MQAYIGLWFSFYSHDGREMVAFPKRSLPGASGMSRSLKVPISIDCAGALDPQPRLSTSLKLGEMKP